MSDPLAPYFDALRHSFAVVEAARAFAVEREMQATETANGLSAKLAEQTAEVVALRKQLEAGGSGMPIWKPGMKLAAGGQYIGPQAPNAHTLNIDLPGITFNQGWGPAFNVRTGGADFTAKGTRFDRPDIPAEKKGKLGIPTAVETAALNTKVIGCIIGRYDNFVKAMPGANGTLLMWNTSGPDFRAAFFYGAGAKNTTLMFNVAEDSHTENLVRFSPQDVTVDGVKRQVVSDGAVIAWNILANPGNKAVIELRSVLNAYLITNDLRASHGHSCIGIGRKSLADGPGATNVYALNNICRDGRVEVDAGAKDVVIEGTTFYGLRINQPDDDDDDHGIKADGQAGTLENLRLRNNVGIVPAQPRQTFFGARNPERIKGLDVDASNSWRVQL